MDLIFAIPFWIIQHVHPLLAWVLLILYFSLLTGIVVAPLALIYEALEKSTRKG